jgi:hypothetical protein
MHRDVKLSKVWVAGQDTDAVGLTHRDYEADHC